MLLGLRREAKHFAASHEPAILAGNHRRNNGTAVPVEPTETYTEDTAMSCTLLKNHISRTSTLILALAAVVTVSLTTTAVAQTFSVVYNFGSQDGDVLYPDQSGIIAQGRDGNLYGTTPYGTPDVAGGVFKLTPAGTETVLFSFDYNIGYPHGSHANGGLTLGTDGNFYGTTTDGGANNLGTVFKITPAGTLSVLYTFTNGIDGSQPYAPPIQGNDGNFYGTTTQCEVGPGCAGGYGTIYKITPAGTFTPLYQFDQTHGQAPVAPLVLGNDGNFYGTAEYGGTGSAGVLFRITPAGKYTLLHSFDTTHGGTPMAPLVLGTDGNFYGTTIGGGTHDAGVVFRMAPSGAVTVLHNINGTSDGINLYAGLVQASDGNFYGVTGNGGAASTGCPTGCGTFFKMTPSGVFSVPHNFDGPTGMNPYVTPFQSTSGLIYGDTYLGGTGSAAPCSGGCGVVYSWNQGLHPFVRLVTFSGKVGKVIEFLGQGLKGTTAVSFNGKPATFTVASATYMTATVPTGATSGNVTVTTPGGVLTSNKKFRVTPQITSFTPSTGSVGAIITITGVSLTQTTKITFGGIAAPTFTLNSDTQVTVTVPTGAATGKIVVTTSGGTATSATSFTVM